MSDANLEAKLDWLSGGKTAEELVKEAQARKGSEEMYAIFKSARNKVKGKVVYESSAYLAMGVLSLLVDGFRAAYEPGKKVLTSDGVKAMVENKFGEGVTFKDALLAEVTKDKDPAKQVALEDLFGKIGLVDKRVSELSAYCLETGKDPKVVVNSHTDMLPFLEREYGSFAAYVTKQEESIKRISDAREKVKQFAGMPFELLMNAIIASKLDPEEQKLFNLNPAELGKIAGAYVKDACVFAEAYLGALIKHSRLELTYYQAAYAQRK